MDDKETINVDDINYAVYKIGDWENNYEINQIGLSNEIPVTKNTLDHVKFSMDEIRNTEFSISDKKVNGFVAIAMQLNPKVQEMELDEAIALEQKEFDNIVEELDGLDLIGDDQTIPLDGEEYLIYKLEKDCHVTTSIPANDFTKEFFNNELKKIEDALD
ncbi:MAG: hypothetical protein IJL02_03335 [Methanobrevibacter sp.]|uniref:hypothetical protein n=1 Tax=Methanobrevibacter sp. TaxID=66852 RepID=UPI0025CEE663|nr:hypothetical protein [Methanobrevibacter sp.]MBQ6098882.1 hypothetical protein [Methanobrevibacter sp.]